MLWHHLTVFIFYSSFTTFHFHFPLSTFRFPLSTLHLQMSTFHFLLSISFLRLSLFSFQFAQCTFHTLTFYFRFKLCTFHSVLSYYCFLHTIFLILLTTSHFHFLLSSFCRDFDFCSRRKVRILSPQFFNQMKISVIPLVSHTRCSQNFSVLRTSIFLRKIIDIYEIGNLCL